MYASTSLSDAPSESSELKRHQRVNAAAAVSLKHDGSATRLDRLYQQGSAKIRFPKYYNDQLEAVLINTAGGLTGGDNLSWDVTLDKQCKAVITTQACEKAYKASSGVAKVQTCLNLQKDSVLHWVPQETILYEGSSLQRHFEVNMETGAELLALECIMLGREAMGETLADVYFHDRWRIRSNGKLIFADDLHLTGNESVLAKMGGKRALASLLFVSSKDEETLQTIVTRLRDVCQKVSFGFSAFQGKITGRILASDTYELRQALVPVLKVLRGTELPRVWRI